MARLLPLLALKTVTLSLDVTMVSGVGSAGASAMGLSGVPHSPSVACLFPAGGWRPGESWVAICGRADRLVTCLAALTAPRVVNYYIERRCVGYVRGTLAAARATLLAH